jgi:hypothetical protein
MMSIFVLIGCISKYRAEYWEIVIPRNWVVGGRDDVTILSIPSSKSLVHIENHIKEFSDFTEDEIILKTGLKHEYYDTIEHRFWGPWSGYKYNTKKVYEDEDVYTTTTWLLVNHNVVLRVTYLPDYGLDAKAESEDIKRIEEMLSACKIYPYCQSSPPTTNPTPGGDQVAE